MLAGGVLQKFKRRAADELKKMREHLMERKEELTQRALTIYKELKNKEGIANSTYTLAGLAHSRGDIEAAERSYFEVQRIYEELKDKIGIASMTSTLAGLARSRGDIVTAERSYLEVQRMYEELKSKSGLSGVITTLGGVHKQFGRIDEAEEHYRRALAIDEELRIFRRETVDGDGAELPLDPTLDANARNRVEGLDRSGGR